MKDQELQLGRFWPPTLRAVARELRDLNAHYDGPGPIALYVHEHSWSVVGYDSQGGEYEHADHYGREEIPGDDQPFDAVGVARRLLADYRNGVRS